MSLILTEDEITERMSDLVDAKRAYKELLKGEAARVFVDQNGERVEYQAANPERLRAYIMTLEAEISTGRKAGITGPMRFNIL